MKHGKIYQFFKDNWHSLLYGFAIFAGILGGIWACSKSATVAIDAYRPRIVVEQPKHK